MASGLTKFGNDLYTGKRSFAFVGRRRIWFIIAAVLVLARRRAVHPRWRDFAAGFKFGIEFRGGSQFSGPERRRRHRPAARDRRRALGRARRRRRKVTTVGDDGVRVQTDQLTTRETQRGHATRSPRPTTYRRQVDLVVHRRRPGVPTSPRQALVRSRRSSSLLAAVLMALYFRTWKMSAAAIIALLARPRHHGRRLRRDRASRSRPAAVIGFLTILGYSLYDTVVVFDKIRENTTEDGDESDRTFGESVNLAVNQTLVRSINTGVVAALPVAAILFIGAFVLGADTLRDISLALLRRHDRRHATRRSSSRRRCTRCSARASRTIATRDKRVLALAREERRPAPSAPSRAADPRAASIEAEVQRDAGRRHGSEVTRDRHPAQPRIACGALAAAHLLARAADRRRRPAAARRCGRTIPKGDLALIERAYAAAEQAHDGQKRKSGEPYITHPVAVAQILADLGIGPKTIAAALLHDTVEDTDYTLDQVRADFGDEIAMLVDGVTKLDKVKYGDSAQAETVRKMIVAMSKDIRVLDHQARRPPAQRPHLGLRAAGVGAHARPRRPSRSTRRSRTGSASRPSSRSSRTSRSRCCYPKLYVEIESLVQAAHAAARGVRAAGHRRRQRRPARLRKIKGTVVGRPKQYYSIYQKMVVRGREFDEIYDLVGIRVLVN